MMTTDVQRSTLTVEFVRRMLYRRELALARQRAALARSLGVTGAELLALLHLGQHHELRPTQLARLLRISSGGMTAMIQRLERAGHIVRQDHPTDGRSALIRLSGASRARMQEAEAALSEGVARLIGDLDEPGRAAVAGFLGGLAAVGAEAADSLRRAEADGSEKRAGPVPSLWS
jgi:DNA-binding MarR family transcriptional regulator